jgi:putative ABC transport system substrate-binding protein
MIKRREFITLLVGTAASVTLPLAAPAQPAGKLPTIGFLGASSASGQAEWTAAFVQRLRELGWIEGRTIAIEYRWAEGRNDRFAEFAAEFVRLKVDIILTDGGATLAAKKVTSVIPIVFAVAADPLGGGYVASLSRPGGNVTGSSVQASDTASKRLGLLREVLPGLHRLAILVNPNYPAAVREMGEVEAAAHKFGFEIIRAEIRRAEDIAPAIEGVKDRADALYVCTDSFANSNRVLINTSALATRLPTMQRQTRRNHFSSAALSRPDDLLRRSKPLGSADFVAKVVDEESKGRLGVEASALDFHSLFGSGGFEATALTA